jgi:hypothetical protein
MSYSILLWNFLLSHFLVGKIGGISYSGLYGNIKVDSKRAFTDSCIKIPAVWPAKLRVRDGDVQSGGQGYRTSRRVVIDEYGVMVEWW